MLKISKTKSGNIRINLDVDKFRLVARCVQYSGDERLDKIDDVMQDFIDQQNDQETAE